jgi:hypothetical protein
MSSTTYFSDAEGFQRQSDEFISWLSQKPDVRVNPAIQIRDMRSQNAGRGVGMFRDHFRSKLSSPVLSLFVELRAILVSSCLTFG